MYQTDTLLTFSFPMGRLLGVPLRLSFLMPVVSVALMWRFGDMVFGAIASIVLLLSLLIHEIGHLLAARRAYCLPSAVVIWPLGGMHNSRAQLSFGESCSIYFAGPILNMAIAAGCGWRLYELQLLNPLLNPFGVFDLQASNSLAVNCLRVTFAVNYCLCLFNLIPVRPLDAGQALAAFLNLRFVDHETRDLMIRIGLVVSLFGILSGFVFDISSLVALSAFLFVLHLHEISQWTPPSSEPEESFLGYDFSEGYTSLSRSEESELTAADDEAGPGILDRWKARREEERASRDQEEQEFEEQQMDRILEKLHTEGRDSLSTREINILNRVSARLRQRNMQD